MIRNFIRLLKRCVVLALPFGKARMILVGSLAVCNAILQVVGVTSVFPFFALAADMQGFMQSSIGKKVLGHLPDATPNGLLVYAGAFSILALFVSNIFGLTSEVIRVYYGNGLGHFLRLKMLSAFASRPYGYFLERNSNALLQRIHGDISNFVNNVFQPIMEILSRLLVVVLILAAIFMIHPYIALGSGLGLGGVYFSIFYFLRSRSRRIGEGLSKVNTGASIAVTEYIQGIKPVLVHGKADYFIERYAYNSYRQAELNSKLPIYGSGPRYLIEPIAFGGLVLVVLIMVSQGRSFSDILPNLAVLALAGYRILPSFQLLYSQLNQVYTMQYVVREVESEIAESGQGGRRLDSLPVKTPISFEKEIRLNGITFSYPTAKRPVIEKFDLIIPKNSAIGIAGTTGSGKSTLVDILLGLHLPQAGHLSVDGLEIAPGNLPAWRALVGYVPQDIYLLDASIAENIAFGIAPDAINRDMVRQAAEAAQVASFVQNELPQTWDTKVGERGVRLSGGQRQRIGLARALYHRPQLLVLDEATSALDIDTEKAVMQTIQALQRSVTMVIVAHRLSTLEKCDRIIQMGTLEASTVN